MVFIGGSPKFDESTGKNRPPEEVYKIIFGSRPDGGSKPGLEKPKPEPKPVTGGPDPRPEVERPDPRVEEYRKLEKWLEDLKADAAKAERDLQVKIAEANKNPDKREVEIHVKNLRAEHERAMKGNEGETKHITSRLAELKKIPEVVICFPEPVFPPKPVRPVRPFPQHWGKPPAAQTRDLVELPFGFGKGSGTLARWIKEKVEADKNRPKPEPKPLPVRRAKEPPRPNKIADAAKEKMDAYKKEQESLRQALQAKLAALGKKADKETVKETVESFRKENADRIKAQAEKAKAVHAALKAARPERKPRPEPPAAVKTKIEAVKVAHKELHTARVNLRKDLKDASEEKRKELLETFKEGQKAKHEELKNKEKELREAIRAQKDTGDRRTSR